MPIYEYECKKCGKVLEAYQKFSEAPLKKCKHCSGRLNKLISNSTFHLKGSGWYVTDYGKGSGAAPSTSKAKDNETKSKAEKTEKVQAPKKESTSAS